MNKNSWLILGIALICFSLYSSNTIRIPSFPTNPVKETINIPEPNTELKELSEPIIRALREGSSDRKTDGYRLACLYKDMALLISVDKDILKTTEAIRQANVLSAKMLNIDLKGKYDGLADATNNLFKKYVSENSVVLDDELRRKSTEAFNALSWAFLEGSKQ
jgi:hypothetical protein